MNSDRGSLAGGRHVEPDSILSMTSLEHRKQRKRTLPPSINVALGQASQPSSLPAPFHSTMLKAADMRSLASPSDVVMHLANNFINSARGTVDSGIYNKSIAVRTRNVFFSSIWVRCAGNPRPSSAFDNNAMLRTIPIQRLGE